METLEEDVNRYTSYFQNELEKAKLLESPLFTKIILFSILDSLSLPICPKGSGNKTRLTKCIGKFCDWEDSKRVSLIQLYRKILKYPELRTNPLCQNIISRLDKLNKNLKNRFSICIDIMDPYIDELIEFVNNGTEKKLIDSSTHIELLYFYRNVLVHEYRIMGYGFETNSSTPYYSPIKTYELVYPREFMINMVQKSILNSSFYLLDKEINPYEHYNFGSLWERV